MKSDRAREALIDLLYRQSYAVLFANFVIPIPVAYVFRGVLPETALLTWVGAIYLLSVLRIVLAHRYFKRDEAAAPALRWAWRATVLSWLSSLLWGLIGWLGFVHGEPHIFAFTCIVLTGLVCGAVPSLSAFPAAYAGSLVAMLLPMAVRCLISEAPIYSVYLGFIICLAAVNLYYSRVTYLTLVETVRLRSENLELIGSLERQRDRAQAADRSKSRFLAAASHDLRQPIHALSLFIAALATLAQRGDVRAAEARNMAGRLQAVVGNLGDLLNGLLDISRLDAGVVPVGREPVSLGRLFADLSHEYAGAARERGLDWRIAKTSLWVDSDPVLLKRVLGNLVSNAFRYTTTGGVLLGCRRRSGGKVEIQVLDTGIGIAGDQQAVIFDEFVQLQNPEHDRAQGLGLGLAIVRRVAQLLEHGVGLRSIDGRGSVFSLTVPVAAPAAMGQAIPSAMATHGLGILVVDDERDVLDAISGLLDLWGHRVYAGRSAAEACRVHAEAARQGDAPADLILVDYRLSGGVTGADAIREIAAHLGCAPPAIIITGDTSPVRLKEAAASGHRLLHKPIGADNLREAIAASLR
ncbi:hybrid sensor histidine kinase/response regulator [Phreatobacter stygius]|uniref:histidine kinase n=1 Tax=Phreatobacter stygius TaxID=1940610 RepID=A0A4D7B573_9HYPH|nr:hybrid sensor histidine kinase/response regulator [Phreatobacter stygius]QCI65588.1 response regulator [Phreatobacter stygius]